MSGATVARVTPLGDAARSRLAELEATVERGLQTFIEVGQALMEIRDERLYRETHATFEAYCEERWGFTGRRARQLVEASIVGTMVPVENERQARELAPLVEDEKAVVETFREAVAAVEEQGGKLTARMIRNAVRKRAASAVREAKSRSEEIVTCEDCGVTSPTDCTAPDHIFMFLTGSGSRLCQPCLRRHREAEREAKRVEHERWWASLSDEERHTHLEAEADAEARRVLLTVLRALCEPEGIVYWIREAGDELRAVEGRCHPDLLRCIAAESAEIVEAAREIEAWALSELDERRGA